MSFGVFNMIASGIYSIIGGTLMLPLTIIATIAMLLLAIKGGKLVFFIVLVPLVTTLTTLGLSSFFEGMSTGSLAFAVAGWLALGALVAFGFMKIIR